MYTSIKVVLSSLLENLLIILEKLLCFKIACLDDFIFRKIYNLSI